MRTKKDDRRVRYTKMVLKDSLLKLLSEKDISRITIKEICDGADVNRATFYAHYADQYDLLLPVEGVSESMGAGSIDVLLEKYPSYEAYFEAEYGLTTARLAALRDFYLE